MQPTLLKDEVMKIKQPSQLGENSDEVEIAGFTDSDNCSILSGKQGLNSPSEFDGERD